MQETIIQLCIVFYRVILYSWLILPDVKISDYIQLIKIIAHGRFMSNSELLYISPPNAAAVIVTHQESAHLIKGRSNLFIR